MNFKYKDLYILLGLNIAYYRKLNNFTQESLSEKINICLTHLAKIETGKSCASLRVIFSIANELEIPTYKLFEFRE